MLQAEDGIILNDISTLPAISDVTEISFTYNFLLDKSLLKIYTLKNIINRRKNEK